MNITIKPEILKELEYIVELHQQYEEWPLITSVEVLVERVLFKVADGSRRPGSWERGVLESMGLVADCEEHQQYRRHYGKPGA